MSENPGTGTAVGLVLCAGLGTRLRPLTERVPKPAMPVGGIPLVRYTLGLLAHAGVERAVVNVHHLPEEMARVALGAASELGLPLAVSHEPVIAGTGGALREARALLLPAREVVVVNGDVLFDVDLAAVLAAHRASGAFATMVLAPMPPGASYAAVEADASLRVRRIAGRFGPGGAGLTSWHFTGVHVVSGGLLSRVAAEPFELDVNRHVYPPLMEEGAVRGVVVRGYWNDLGTPSRYLAAHEELLAGEVPLARFHGADPRAGLRQRAPGVFVGGGAAVAPGAVLLPPLLVGAGVTLGEGAVVGPSAAIGARASIGRGARVSRAVVWEDTAIQPGEVVDRAVAAGAARLPA